MYITLAYVAEGLLFVKDKPVTSKHRSEERVPVLPGTRYVYVASLICDSFGDQKTLNERGGEAHTPCCSFFHCGSWTYGTVMYFFRFNQTLLLWEFLSYILCHGHISCDALPDELATSFAYIALWHTRRTEVALGNLGIAGLNYSLKIFWASPMSDMQMRHHEHVSKPSGGGSRRRGVALHRQACRCAMYLGPGAPQGLQWHFGDVLIAGQWSWNGWTMARR